MTNRYTATASNGQLFKRTSKERVYTHCVIARRTTEQEIARYMAASPAKYWGEYWMDHSRIAKAGPGVPGIRCKQLGQSYNDVHLGRSVEDVARSEAFLAANPTPFGFAEAKVAEHVARIRRDQLGRDGTFWQVGWCGRHDLAHKQACATLDGFTDVEILHAKLA